MIGVLKPEEKPDLEAGMDVLKVWLFSCPELVAQHSISKVRIQNDIKDLQARISKLKMAVVLNVSVEKDEDGKLRFTNQALREAEAERKLEEENDYQDLVSDLRNLYLKLEDAKAKEKYYDQMLSVVKIVVKDDMERKRMCEMREMQATKIKQMEASQ